MPIIWSYLLRKFLSLFFLSLFSFVALLMITRLKEIAQFATLASSFLDVLFFSILQIPHLLTLAVPISCFLAAFSLFRSFSKHQELTAFRASQLSLWQLILPLLFAVGWISLFHFYICSELISYSKHTSREMIVQNTTQNPLILLKRQKLFHWEANFMDFDLANRGKKAKHLFFIFPNPSQEGLILITAESFSLKNHSLLGKNVCSLTTFTQEKEDFDALILENEASLSTQASDLSYLLKPNKTRMNPSSLPLRLLYLHSQAKEKLFFLQELVRRFSLAISVFSFTLLGACSGVEIGRNPNWSKQIGAFLLAILILVSYLYGKQMKSTKEISLVLFLLPHILAFWLSSFYLKRINQGYI